MESDTLIFYVNGHKVVEPCADPGMTLLTYLRSHLRLPGTKLGCGEGGCGACTVMVSAYDRENKAIRHYSVNACLAPLCAMHGLAVTTVEGIGSTRTQLHPVQVNNKEDIKAPAPTLLALYEGNPLDTPKDPPRKDPERMAKFHGSQCGFCTPGIVMSMYTLLRNNPQPALMEMESAFEGNLCRCTGYRPILAGFKTFTKEFQCGMGENCCRNQKQDNMTNGVANGVANGVFSGNQQNGVINGAVNGVDSDYGPYDPTQEPIFPNELQLSDTLDRSSLTFKSDRITWHRPATMQELLELKKEHPQAKLVIGNTEVGVEVKLKNFHYPVLIAPTHIEELKTVNRTDEGIVFGSATTLTHLEHVLKEAVEELPEYQTRVFSAVVEMLRWFAGHQIRNVAAISGNIMTASPISDLNPLFLAAGCKLLLQAKDSGQRTVTMDEKFFTGYRRTIVAPDEVLVSILIPYTKKDEYFLGYKQAHRREDDISIVNAGLRVLFEPDTSTIQDIQLSFGGMAPTTVMAVATSKKLIGMQWTDDMVTMATKSIGEELSIPAGTPGGMEAYRNTLTTSFFFKFYLTVLGKLQEAEVSVPCPLSTSDQSAIHPYTHTPSRGTQVWEEVPEGQRPEDAVGRPIQHLSSQKQATGEAVYVDDMPTFRDELYLALVTSTKAHATLRNVDPSEALKLPGVHSYLCADDVPGSNSTGIYHDEEIFASEKVVAPGQVIGAILADTQAQAQRAAKAVKIDYEVHTPIITIEQAIAAKAYLEEPVVVRLGDVDAGLAAADHVIEGEARIGGQEHFYLETQATIAVPKEDGEMELFASVQNMCQLQMQVAEALNVPANRVTARVKRLGGGFGGKESRFSMISLPVAVAAYKTQRPVRCMLDRDEDMVMTGTRHPYLGRYKVGFTKDGLITALKLDLYANAGHSIDLSRGVLDRAVLHCDNTCNIKNVMTTGYMCKTNMPSNTAFRGFGSPQAMFVMESIVTHIAETLEVSPEQIRSLNMYKEGEQSVTTQLLENCTLRQCWDQTCQNSQFERRRQEVDQFNKSNRWKKRGISVVGTKFGISFGVSFLNQTGALVHVYTDGSVLLTHGNIEMGQGLHTKIIQVASRVLQIPTSKIYISESATNLVPNTSATAASMGSDLSGMAVMNACEKIMARLKPIKEENPKGTWKEWVNQAYLQCVSLSATGYYELFRQPCGGIPIIAYDFTTNKGRPFMYYVYGAACSEVEIDCLTGDHRVLRTDIVMDLGRSLNPAIDIGQIEGAFVQGYGLFVLEQQKYSPDGFLFTRGPGAYKIPGFGDIPAEFNVSLLKGASNPKAVYSSKAVGEPPLFLSASVFFAIRDAVKAARAESGIKGHFFFNSPATPERIRMACVDQFTQQFPEAEPGTYKPWFVEL